ncbi:MAG TPA: DUF499 domain-containing protein, partial [Planctomycetota bacterium]|nr:DUF499 domain-containing protein [Planctomycetota bacterium]
IPGAVDAHVRENLFEIEQFEELVLALAAQNDSLGKLLRELQEPRPGGLPCIPWIGETYVKERLVGLCAQGKIAINVRGSEFLQALPGELPEAARARIKGKLYVTGKQLDETSLHLPQPVPWSGGAGSPGGAPPPGPAPAGGCAPGPAAPQPAPPPGPGNSIFQPPPAVAGTSHSAPANSPLNLLGSVESWGVGPGTPVSEVAIKVKKLTGAQLQSLLKKLPDGITYELSLQKEGA